MRHILILVIGYKVRFVLRVLAGEPYKSDLQTGHTEIVARRSVGTHIPATLRLVLYQLACRISGLERQVKVETAVETECRRRRKVK